MPCIVAGLASYIIRMYSKLLIYHCMYVRTVYLLKSTNCTHLRTHLCVCCVVHVTAGCMMKWTMLFGYVLPVAGMVVY